MFTFSQIQPAQQQQHDQEVPEEQFSTLFCRALYDYEAQDASALSFCRGDIIEVLNQQPSGWWDGLLADERGWFPSNYVEVISDEEADMAFAAMESSGIEGTVPENDQTMLGMTPASVRGMNQTENEEWLASELSYRNEGTMPPNTHGHSTPSSDFWVPQVTTDGQVRYLSTPVLSVLLSNQTPHYRFTTSIHKPGSFLEIFLKRQTTRFPTQSFRGLLRNHLRSQVRVSASYLDQNLRRLPVTDKVLLGLEFLVIPVPRNPGSGS